MASRIRRTKNRPARASRLIRAGDRTMTFIRDEEDVRDGIGTPSIEEIEAALSQVPEELSWDWASERLIPLFERGYGDGVTGDQMINTVSHLGVGIGFGIDFGPAFGRVTKSMAQRWEASVEQIEHAAFARLAKVATAVGSSDLQSVIHRGHFFRSVLKPEGWASSVILAGDEEVARIFGTRDAIFTVPARNCLVAFGPGTPLWAVEDVTMELESIDPHPLRMEPFVMTDGVIHWQGLDEEPVHIG